MKSDNIDAVRAARQALAGVGLSEPRRRGVGVFMGVDADDNVKIWMESQHAVRSFG